MNDVNLPETHAPVKLKSFATEFDADALTNELRRQGINAHTLGGPISGFKAEVPTEVVVVVSAVQLDIAREYLEQLDSESKVDWSNFDVGDESPAELDENQGQSRLSKTVVKIMVRGWIAAWIIWLGYAVFQLMSS